MHTATTGKSIRSSVLLAVLALMTAAAGRAKADWELSTLGSFNYTNGSFPIGGVAVDSAGNVYGTTSQGGANGFGTFFGIAKGAGAVTTSILFNGTNGGNPNGGLVMDSAGNVYGTTYTGGATGDGSVFEIAKGSTTVTTLASFQHNSSGTNPIAGVMVDGAGNLFGTTFGGANSAGTVYEIAKGSGVVTTLATFAFNGSNGGIPYGGVVMDGAGNLFGTTYGTGAGTGASINGTVFEIVKGSGVVTTLAKFNGANGANPTSGVIMDSAGNLYGTTISGGANSYGTVFELAHGTNMITTLASFNIANGSAPWGGVIMDGAGNLYGTTSGGGANGDGTVFELAQGSNTVSTLVSFNDTNGQQPLAGVVMDGDGNLYGATEYGGPSSLGTVFELSPTVVPEPSSIALMAVGGLILAGLARRRMSKTR